MNILERIRKAWDALRGHYEATRFSPHRSRVDGSYQSARLDISQEVRVELVRLSRYWEKNSPLVQRLASLHETYTVGNGLVIQPASSDEDWNKATREAWEDWSQYADLTTRQPLGSLQSMASRSWWVDGEAFLLKTAGRSGRPRLQAIEGDLVVTPREHRKDHLVYDGIRFDSNGRALGFYIARTDARGKPTEADFWEAKDVEHIFEPDRPGQHRGIPSISASLNHLHDLEDLAMFEMQAAKEAASITNVLTNETGDFDPRKVNKIGFTKTLEAADGSTITETRQKEIQDILGARSVALKVGEKLEQFRSQRPGVVTMDYWRYLEEQVCTSTGIPYVLAHPDSMQGTVYRGALDMAASYFRARFLILAGAMERIFRWWVEIERLANPAMRNLPPDWWRVTILPPRAVNVDIGRNASAMQTELQCGATNLAIVYGAQGLDWRREIKALAEQVAFAKEQGLTLSFGNTAADSPTTPQNSQAEDEDEPPHATVKK